MCVCVCAGFSVAFSTHVHTWTKSRHKYICVCLCWVHNLCVMSFVIYFSLFFCRNMNAYVVEVIDTFRWHQMHDDLNVLRVLFFYRYIWICCTTSMLYVLCTYIVQRTTATYSYAIPQTTIFMTNDKDLLRQNLHRFRVKDAHISGKEEESKHSFHRIEMIRWEKVFFLWIASSVVRVRVRSRFSIGEHYKRTAYLS